MFCFRKYLNSLHRLSSSVNEAPNQNCIIMKEICIKNVRANPNKIHIYFTSIKVLSTINDTVNLQMWLKLITILRATLQIMYNKK